MALEENPVFMQEKAFMNEYWTFRKAVWEPRGDDEYWEYVVKYGNYLGDKYRGNTYITEMVINCIADLEKRFRDNDPLRADKVFLRIMNKIRQERGLPDLMYRENHDEQGAKESGKEKRNGV